MMWIVPNPNSQLPRTVTEASLEELHRSLGVFKASLWISGKASGGKFSSRKFLPYPGCGVEAYRVCFAAAVHERDILNIVEKHGFTKYVEPSVPPLPVAA